MFSTAIFLALLHTSLISIGKETISVEIADTPETRHEGLMGRKNLPENTGMLFVFPEPSILGFWMKDTLIPLSIAFFDQNKKLIEIVDMPVLTNKTEQPPIFNSSALSLYALEVPQHWFQDKGIEVGMEFSFLDHPNPLE